VTIQNKVEPKDARRLQQQLAIAFQARPLSLKALAMWRYRDGPWEAVKSWSFRGG
jgi:hypothetical protein